MNEFKKVNIKDYILALLNEKPVINAMKISNIIVKKGEPGNKVLTYTNNGLLETVNYIKDDGKNYYIACNQNNKSNTWIISEEYLLSNYVLIDNNGLYKPKKNIKKFIIVDEDIEFISPWGELMKLKKGGYLNITNIDEIVCIQKEEFIECYSIV